MIFGTPSNTGPDPAPLDPFNVFTLDHTKTLSGYGWLDTLRWDLALNRPTASTKICYFATRSGSDFRSQAHLTHSDDLWHSIQYRLWHSLTWPIQFSYVRSSKDSVWLRLTWHTRMDFGTQPDWPTVSEANIHLFAATRSGSDFGSQACLSGSWYGCATCFQGLVSSLGQ